MDKFSRGKVVIVGIGHGSPSLVRSLVEALPDDRVEMLLEVTDDRYTFEEEVPCIYELERLDYAEPHTYLQEPKKLHPYGPTQRGRRGKNKRW